QPQTRASDRQPMDRCQPYVIAPRARHTHCRSPSSPTSPELACKLSTVFHQAHRETRRRAQRLAFHSATLTQPRLARRTFRNSLGKAVSIAEEAERRPVALPKGEPKAYSKSSSSWSSRCSNKCNVVSMA